MTAYCPKTGKISYPSKAEARATMQGMKSKKLRTRTTANLNVFVCKFCNQWHIGNKDKENK